MLLNLKFKNVRSYREENSFSLISPSGKVKSRYPDNFETLNRIDVLKSAVVIGENAGGKSNFVFVLEFLKHLFSITDRPVKSYSNIVFSVNKAIAIESKDKINQEIVKKTEQSIEIEVIASDGLIYHYSLSIDCIGIKKEVLTYRKRYKAVEKESFSYTRTDSFEGKKVLTASSLDVDDGNIKIDKETIKRITSNGLIVNSLSLIGIKHTAPLVTWIKDTLTIVCSSLPLNYVHSFDGCDLEDVYKVMNSPNFIDIFKLVDSSIVSIDVDKEKPFSKTVVKRMINGRLWPRTIEDDSSGVKQFLALSYDVYKVIKEGKVFFADELDSMLNPILTMKLVNYIHSFDNCGQFIFTSHNVTHLNLQLFMKEQMFIVGKNKATLESTICSLGSFKELRYDSNQKIYEYYLKGLLGGVDNA